MLAAARSAGILPVPVPVPVGGAPDHVDRLRRSADQSMVKQTPPSPGWMEFVPEIERTFPRIGHVRSTEQMLDLIRLSEGTR